MQYPGQEYHFDKYRPSRQARKLFYVLQNLPPDIRPIQHSSAWEAKRDHLTFYGEIKTVMIILRMIGVLPYSTTSTGKINFTQRDLQILFEFIENFYSHN
jgi:hypothetical protein